MGGGSKLSELTSILVESESAVEDAGGAKQHSPLESQRMWERQAEENVLERLDKAGLLAPSAVTAMGSVELGIALGMMR